MAKNTRKTIVKTTDASYNKDRRGSEESAALKAFRKLTLADRFIFYKVMQDRELCRRLLEIILDVEIERIEYLEGEKTIEVKKEAKGIRLDIYVKDEAATVYNVEMQAVHAADLPQRSRYYQNLIDADLLDRGVDYRLLNKSFVIFSCLEDIMKKTGIAGKTKWGRSRLCVMMLFSVMCFFTACGGGQEETIEDSLTDMMSGIYETAELSDDFRQGLANFETVALTEDMETSILGTDEIEYTEAVVSMPMMSSIAYQCVLLRVDEDSVDAVKQQLRDSANPDKWVCVSAETVLIESRENVIFYVMAEEDTAYALDTAFQNY